MLRAGAPIDGFGIGTSLTTSSDVPALDCAYKLQEYAGLPRRKRSIGKATWPGRKQVWRRYGSDGRMAGDVLSIESDHHAGEPLIQPVMRAGRRIGPPPTLAEIRARAARDLARLPEPLRRLEPRRIVSGRGGGALVRLAAEVDSRLAPHDKVPAMSGNLTIGDRDVLLVVDIQNDFCPEGRLAVPRGDEVVPLINRLGTRFEHVVLTQDWHPPGHLSFASAHPGRKPYETIEVSYGPQILWPDHCVQGTPGRGIPYGPADPARRAGPAQRLSPRHRFLFGVL